MARRFKYSNRYKKDFRRMEKRGKNMDKLRPVLTALLNGAPLPEKYRNHPLKGNWAHHMECHIEPDWLLIYQLNSDFVYLVATGSHAYLFDK